ncbi:hypothetical protein MMPV_005501 [Pyropia vietnamensis]
MDEDNFAATQRANKASALSARYHICVLVLCVLLAAAAAAAGIYTLIRDTPLPGALLLVLSGILIGVAALGTVRHRGAARLYAITAVLVGLACAAGAAASVVGAILAAGDGEGGTGVGFFVGVAVGLAAVAIGLWVDVCVVGGRRAVAMAGGSTSWREEAVIAPEVEA